MKRSAPAVLVLLTAAIQLCGCGGGNYAQSGSTYVTVSVGSAVSAAAPGPRSATIPSNVASLRLTVSATATPADMTPIVSTLTVTPGVTTYQLSVTVPNGNRRFLLEAFDAASVLCYRGHATTVLTGGTASLTIQMGSDVISPSVLSVSPVSGATGVTVSSPVTVTFSEAMDATTVTVATFTVTAGGTPVPGTVGYSGTTATFTPTSNWNGFTSYTVTVTTEAEDLAGNAIASDYVWSFTTGASAGMASAPTFSPSAGTYASAQSVTLLTSTPGATIRYTTDGSTPTSTTGTVYAGPIAVSATTTINAIAYLSGWADSAVASGTYTITGTVSTAGRIAAGGSHTVAFKSDGTVWAWGYNGYGELGDGTTTGRSLPVQVTGLSGVAAVAAGDYHTVAAKSDGTVWAWGFNADGQLGDNTTTDRLQPVQVTGLSGVVAVAGGSMHTVAVKSDGTVWAWGGNGDGQLGDGTVTNSSVPVQVAGLSGVAAIAAGSIHSVAVKSDGTVWAWGYNGAGQLGDGTVTDSSVPVQVTGLSGVVAIAAGSTHTVALKSDGTVWAWGYNGNGQLGDGTTTTRLQPVQVTGLSGVVAVAGGGMHSVAVKSGGTVWAWGFNGNGQLGDGTTATRLQPVQVTGFSGAVAVAGGGMHSVAVKSDGTVWTWGGNVNGQLGDGTTTDRYQPVQVTGNFFTPGPFILRSARRNTIPQPPNAGGEGSGGGSMSLPRGPVTLPAVLGNRDLLVAGLAAIGWRRRIRRKRGGRED